MLKHLDHDEDINNEDVMDGEDYLASDNRFESWNYRLDRLVKIMMK